MGKIIGMILGLAVLAFVGFKAMYGHTSVERGTPKQQLDNVKSAAKDIELKQEQAAEEALKKATAE